MYYKKLIICAVACAALLNVKYYASEVVDADNYISVKTYSSEVKQEIQGVEFLLYNADGDLVDKQYSDSEGNILFDDLSMGSYHIEQGVTPVRYVNSDNTWDIQLSENNSKKTINNPLKSANVATISIQNYSSSGDDVSGFKYNIYDENGKFIQQITTDSNGLATSGDLNFGTYYIQQVDVPVGYICDPIIYKMDVNNQYSRAALTKENKKITSNISYRVIDQNGYVIPGISYNLLQGSNVVSTATSDNNGNVTFSGIGIGKYTIEQAENSGGNYTLSPTYTISISEEESVEGVPQYIQLTELGYGNVSQTQYLLANDDTIRQSPDLMSTGKNLSNTILVSVLILISAICIKVKRFIQ